jgi:Gelsolin repeat
MSKKYIIEGTNIELFGSELEYEVKSSAAKSETAWHDLNLTKPALYIWEITNSKVIKLSDDFNQLFQDHKTYIIFKILKNHEGHICYNIHYWIGFRASQLSMTLVAYKAIELNSYIDRRAIIYREFEGLESHLLKSYFLGGILVQRSDDLINYSWTTFESNYLDHQILPLKIKTHHLKIKNENENDTYIFDCYSMNHLSSIIYVYYGSNTTFNETIGSILIAKSFQLNRDNCFIKYINTDNKSKEFLEYITQYTISYPIKIYESPKFIHIESIHIHNLNYSFFYSLNGEIIETNKCIYIKLNKKKSDMILNHIDEITIIKSIV